jgi:hypothetical protein
VRADRGYPPDYDEWSDTNDRRSYQRGRQWARLVSRDVQLKVDGKVTAQAVELFHKHLGTFSDDGRRAMTSPTKSTHERARQLVVDAVAANVKLWAKEIGLICKNARFGRFQDDVTEALHACMRAQIANPDRRRGSDFHKALKRVAHEAEAAANRLRSLQAALDDLPLALFSHDPSFRVPSLKSLEADLAGRPPNIEGLVAVARRHADAFKQVDKGGRSKMTAFEALAEGLIHAYRNATGQTGKGDAAREGKLRNLVEAVLPTARDLAKDATGEPLQAPEEEGLGEYLHRTARRLRGA